MFKVNVKLIYTAYDNVLNLPETVHIASTDTLFSSYYIFVGSIFVGVVLMDDRRDKWVLISRTSKG